VKPNDFDSSFWKGILRAKDDFFGRGHFKISNGLETRFWEDTWLGDAPLNICYPLLYNIVQQKIVLVVDVMSHNLLNVVFRRNLRENKWEIWCI
jgi:hypothetical protein